MNFSKKITFESEPGFQMGPMIDVVFQMLVYFLAATTMVPLESSLPANLPTTKTTQAVETKQPQEVIIEILQDGTILADGVPYDSKDSEELPQLKSMLFELVSVFKDQGVIIKGDELSYHGRIVEVLNVCAASGVTNISFLGR